MHDDGDIGRPVHHVIAPDELPHSRAKNATSQPTQGVSDLIADITQKYPGLDPERVYEIVRDRRHDVPLNIVTLVMDELNATTRRSSKSK
jgi:hypothetical protein